MEIYSKSINLFTQRCQKYLKEIIQNETQIEVQRTRFFHANRLYPIQVVAFENKQQLAYFNSEFLHIGVNIQLIYQAKESVIKNILRHEFAHYIAYIENDQPLKAHGSEFKAICQRFGWKENIIKASIDIDESNNKLEGDLQAEKLITKVKALLRLAQSSNKFEAEQATLKANQLIIKHQLNKLSTQDDDKIYAIRLLKSKKNNSKLQAIYEILGHFMVNTIIRYGTKFVYLEISGAKENIKLAQYVCSFLEQKFEELFLASNLKGLRAKNSFFIGLAKGYGQKAVGLKNKNFNKTQMALIQQKLQSTFSLVYKKTSKASSNRSTKQDAFQLGIKQGKKLTINKPIKNNVPTLLIGG